MEFSFQASYQKITCYGFRYRFKNGYKGSSQFSWPITDCMALLPTGNSIFLQSHLCQIERFADKGVDSRQFATELKEYGCKLATPVTIIGNLQTHPYLASVLHLQWIAEVVPELLV